MSSDSHTEDEITITPHLLKLKSGQFSLNSITTLNLSHLGIRSISTHFQECRYLRRLDLSHNSIRTLENLAAMAKLEVLDLSYNQISRIPSSIEKLKKLDTLNLKGNLISDMTELENLSLLPVLRSVHFASNPIATQRGYDEKIKTHVKKLTIIDGEHILLRIPNAQWNNKEKQFDLSENRPWDEDEHGETLFQVPKEGSLAKQFPQLVSQYKNQMRDCQRLIARADSLLDAS